jgi:hypothetical protein
MSIVSHLQSSFRLGFIWSVLWVVAALISGTLLGFYDASQIDPGEEPWRLAPLIGVAGFACGVFFSAIFALSGRESESKGIRFVRMIVCGAFAAAIIPLLSGHGIPEMLVLAPLGAGSAFASTALIRRWVPAAAV